ncbi:MAG: hypothetical protein ABL949_11885 [Fimbriimonadaceae bacterium]
MNKISGIAILALIMVGCGEKKEEGPAFIEVGKPETPQTTPVAEAPKGEKMRIPSGFPQYNGLVTRAPILDGAPAFEGVLSVDDYDKVIADFKKITSGWRGEVVGMDQWYHKSGSNGSTDRIMIFKSLRPANKARIVTGSLDVNTLQMTMANIFPFLKERGRDHIKGITTKAFWKDVESGKIEAMLADYRFMAGARKDGSDISSIPIETKDHKRFLCQCKMVVEDGLPRIASISIVPEK